MEQNLNIPRNDPNFQTPYRESWQDMAQNLYYDLNQLWSKESQLIRTELNEKAVDLKVAVGSFVVAGSFLLVGGLAFAATAIIVINIFAPLWMAAVIVTAFFLLIGATLLAAAKKKVEVNRLKPRHSLEAFGEIKNTFQERFHEFKKH